MSFRSERIRKTLERVLDDKRDDDFQVVHFPRAMMEAFIGTREPWEPPRPRTWLLGTGWKKIHGPIVLGMASRGAR